MATESLIVELDARTAKIDAKLKETERRLDGVDGSVKKADRSLSSMGRTAGIVATAVGTVITTTAIAAANYAIEIQKAADRTGETVEEMQALAFASSTVGISLEKLGDIGKDVNEKIGEFTATGGGGFVDFVDVMKLSQIEARKTAEEFQNMSGTDVLQEMVRRMEEAGVSSNQMSFALEGLASDATDLIPLLSNNADEMNRLRGEFEDLGTTLSQEQLNSIRQVGEEFSKLGETFGAKGRELVAEYSEEIISAIDAIKNLGITSIDAFNLIATGWGNIVELAQAGVTDLVNGTDTFGEVLTERTQITMDAINKLLGDSQNALEITIKKGTKAVQEETKVEGLSLKQRAGNLRAYASVANAINEGFLNENKAIKAGLIVADTAAAVMLQLSSGDPFTAFARAAAAAAMGAVQLSNALSSTKGGGTVSGGAGGAGVATSTQQPVQQAETSTLDLSAQDEDSASVLTVRFATDSGDALLDALAEGLNNNERQGR